MGTPCPTTCACSVQSRDYARWKEGHDAGIEQRKASGKISCQIFRNADDPNVVTVLSVQQSAERGQAFLDSPDLGYSAGIE